MKYSYYLSCRQYVGGTLSILFLWRQNQESKKWELSDNKPNDWTPYNETEPSKNSEMFPDKCDWLTKHAAKQLFPLATIT